MTYPIGVQLATLTFSNPVTFLGADTTRTELSIQSTADVVWAADGVPIDSFPERVAPQDGAPGVLTAPYVDQDGFTDQSGKAFKNWAYILTRTTFFNGQSKQVRKTWQPILGQPEIDFDKLPGGSIGLPMSVPIPPVTSVAGLTHAVGAEALAGELLPFIPNDVTPESVAEVLPPRLSEAELKATYAPKGLETSKLDVIDGGQTLAAKIGMLSGPATVALLGDSTGNDDTEWFRTMLNSLGAANPKVGIDYRVWNDTSKTFPAPTTVQAGTQDGIYVKDTFARTGALIGSLPDVGGVWYGDGGADAQYTLNGTSLGFTGTTLASFYAYPGGSGTQKVSTNFTFSAAGASTTLRLFGLYKDANNYVATFITFGASQITWNITKKIAGTFGTVATGTANPFAFGGATFAASITVNGTAVSSVVNGVSLSGTLLAGDVTALASSNPAGGIGFNVVGGSADDFQIERVGTTAAMQLSAYNGSVPGTGTTEALANLDSGILPVAPDLVFLSFSHNHGAETGPVFAGKLQAVVNKVRTLWPNAGIAISSQNPRIAPAANIADHAARNVASRALAKQRQWGYVPAFERFLAQPNINALINTTDGVHPVAAGSLVWRDAALSYMNGMKPVTT